MVKNDKENVYFISYLDKELTQLVEPTNPMKMFLMVLSDVVNIIEVIRVLNNSAEYNEHISNAIVNRISEVIQNIHSLTECGDKYNQFLSYQSFETIRIFMDFIKEEMKSLKVSLKVPLMYIQINFIIFMAEFESFANFTINNMKTLSEKKDNKKTKNNGYFKDINECLSIATGIVYPIERDEANQLFGVILVMAMLIE
ncbi:4137_t:CDS:2, partial [Gigaspora rosea]